jgi:glycosyltransferase involved in cell wall biosynthesis
MKIALISRWYWEESRLHHENEDGGSAQQLAEAVAALGHEVVVLTQSPKVRKLKPFPIGKLETWVSPRGKSRNLFSSLRDRLAKRRYVHNQVNSDALFLRDFLKQRGPFDAIWAHAELPDGLTVAMAAKKGVKVPPMLLQVQALRYRFDKGVPVLTEKRPLDYAFRQASRILVNSELVAGFIPSFAGPGHSIDDLRAKVRVVFPNLQRVILEDATLRPDRPAPMKDRVLYLGSLNRNKGALVFLKAITKTEAAKRNSTFAVIGDFTEYDRAFIKVWEQAKEATRVKLPGARMEYLGRVSSLEVIRQIKLARVVVIPPLFDAFSRGLVEALILGRPVITTDKVGSSPLVAQYESGIVIPPNDPDALAHAIDAVLSPIVPFADNAKHIGPQLVPQFSTDTIAPLIVYHLSRITGQA